MDNEVPIKRLHRFRRVYPLYLLRQYSQHNPGKILLAKRHSSANRPLHKIKSLNQKVKFCPCCNLPEETIGIIERFNFCDSIEDFAECGIGTYLYFFYFQYAIVILIITFFMSSLLTIILNEHYTKGLNNICNQYFLEYGNTKLYPYCKQYISIEKGIGFYNNETDWILRYSSDNLKNYRQIYKDFSQNDDVDNVLVNYSLLHFFTLITLFVVNLIYIVIVNAKKDQVDIMHTTPHDYTLLCTNLNNTVDSYNKYKNFFINNEEIKDKSEIEKFVYFLKTYVLPNNNETLNIYEINICYKLNEFMETQDKINEIEEQIFKIQHHPKQIKLNDNEENQKKLENMSYYSGFLCCKKKISYLKLKTEKRKYEKKLETILKEKMITSKENFAGSVLITFQTIKEKENFYKQFPHSFLEKCFVFIKNLKFRIFCCCMTEERLERFHRRKKIKIYLAPDPEDIIWENMEFTSILKIKRGLLIYIISLLLMGISFGIVLALNYLQDDSEKNNWAINTFMKYGISIIISGVIGGINLAFFYILNFLTKLEYQNTKTDYYLSYSIKLTIFTFINSGVIPLFSNYIQDEWNENDNLLSNILFIFLINSTVTPLMWTFNIGYIIKKIRIYFIEKKSNPNSRHHLSQKELNDLYELPPMDISAKYSYIAKTLLMTFLYIPIFPLGVPISLFGFIFGYFLEKYNFTHIYKRPEMINESICIFYISSFNIYLFCFSIGIWMFMNDTFHSKVWPLIDIIFFGVLCIIPYKQILSYKFLKFRESDINTKTYEEVYFHFYNDYERINPMTKKNGLKNYLFKLKSKGKITKETYDIAIDNIEHLNLMQMYYKNIKNNFLQSNTIYKTIDTNKFDDSSQFNFEEYFENYSKTKNKDKDVKMTKYDYQILQAFGSDLIEKKDSKMRKSVTEKIEDEENNHIMKNYYNPFYRTIGNIIYENSENGKDSNKNSIEIEMNELSDNIIYNDNEIYNMNDIEINNENNNNINNENNNKNNNENNNNINNENNNKINNENNNKINNEYNTKINNENNSKNNNENNSENNNENNSENNNEIIIGINNQNNNENNIGINNQNNNENKIENNNKINSSNKNEDYIDNNSDKYNENDYIIPLEIYDNNIFPNKINNLNTNSNSKNNKKNIIIKEINDINNINEKKSSNRTMYTIESEPKVKPLLQHETPELINNEFSKNN